MKATMTFSLMKPSASKQSKTFNYVLGSVFILMGMAFFFKKSVQTENENWFPVYLFVLGLMGFVRNIFFPFLTVEKYISLTDDFLIIKKGYRREVKFSANEIQSITLKSSNLNVKTTKGEVDFNISDISFKDRQKLKESLSDFCQNTAIEFS